MKNFSIFSALFLMLIFCKPLYSQDISVYSFDEFKPRLTLDTDSVYFINFWATWCVPCVKEMPAIQSIAKKYSDKPLKILLVSLDMPSKLETSLLPFIKKHAIESEVIVLDDPDFNSWIDKVDPSWGGGIPASLIYSKNDRSFYEQSFDFDELDTILNSKLK